MTSMLMQSLASHKDLLRLRTEQIDHLNSEIREFSARQKRDLESLHEIKERVRVRGERQAKIANLKRSNAEKRWQRSSSKSPPSTAEIEAVDPAWLDESSQEILEFSPADGGPNALQRQFLIANVPSLPTLQAHLNAYQAHNADLQKRADELRSRSGEVEAMYRKVVSLCTGVAEDKVEESLPSLVAAVESERGGHGGGEWEVGRVREFLRRVDGAGPIAM